MRWWGKGCGRGGVVAVALVVAGVGRVWRRGCWWFAGRGGEGGGG